VLHLIFPIFLVRIPAWIFLGLCSSTSSSRRTSAVHAPRRTAAAPPSSPTSAGSCWADRDASPHRDRTNRRPAVPLGPPAIQRVGTATRPRKVTGMGSTSCRDNRAVAATSTSRPRHGRIRLTGRCSPHPGPGRLRLHRAHAGPRTATRRPMVLVQEPTFPGCLIRTPGRDVPDEPTRRRRRQYHLRSRRRTRGRRTCANSRTYPSSTGSRSTTSSRLQALDRESVRDTAWRSHRGRGRGRAARRGLPRAADGTQRLSARLCPAPLPLLPGIARGYPAICGIAGRTRPGLPFTVINIEDWGSEPVQDPPCPYTHPPAAALRSGRHRYGGLQVTTFARPVADRRDSHGEIDIFSAPGLRDELLRVNTPLRPAGSPSTSRVTFIDYAGVNLLLANPGPAGLEDGFRSSDRRFGRACCGDLAAGLEWAFGLR